MDGWWSFDVWSDGIQTVQSDFAAIFKASGEPPDAALFVDNLGRGTVRLYFSPEAARIAAHLLRDRQAVVCDKPSKADAVLVSSGDARMLFHVAVRESTK